jgi:Heparinase II/III-like protein/Heparinase II/III N-terminus
MVQQARESPSDAILQELQEFHFLGLDWKTKQELIDAALGVLDGNMRIGTCSTRIAMPFSAQDLDRVPPACGLLFAAFVAPDVLLQAYEATGRKDFFTAAGAFITNAQAYEQGALLPRGYFWNDHAVAARVCVLTNFWRLYRHSPDYRPEVGRQVLQMVARSEQLLAKPRQFTFPTNHGIMQNLALWHASLAFPSLPRAEEYQHLARARITEQMKFYISGEGVVLEHSAGYHLFGVSLLGMAFRYLDLMHQAEPEEWIEKYDLAKKVYATLRRPDGSLPMFGDTEGQTDPLGPLVTTFDGDRRPQGLAYQPMWKPAEAVNLYPVSGYAIWWDGLEFWPNPLNLSQTVVAWSDFPSHAHKHADEMSVLFWAGGQTWLSNIGYWPYESKWRRTIESWAGSNAPHLLGENPAALRTTRLVSSGSSLILRAIELERTGVENYTARRQVIYCKPNLWLVLDNTSGSEKSHTSTTWTSASDVRWQQRQAPGAFRLESSLAKDSLDIFFLGSQDTEQRLLRGNSRPFAGWQVEHGVPVPASALVVEQPAKNSWAATIWTWKRGGAAARFDGTPQMTQWTDASNWEMQLFGEVGAVALRRKGNILRLHSGRGADETLELMAPSPHVGAAYAEVRSQFMASASRYHPFSANLAKRKKITYLLLGIFLLQQIFFLVYKVHGTRVETLKCLNLVVWILGGIWLVGLYC